MSEAMKSQIKNDIARRYLKRWQTVHRAQVKELRSMTPTQRLSQLAVLFHSRGLFGPRKSDTKTTVSVRSRWRRLRKAVLYA